MFYLDDSCKLVAKVQQMPKEIFMSWQLWALLAAVFAAMTALLAKSGVDGLNPDFATTVQTYVIAVSTTSIVLATGAWRNPGPIWGKPLLLLVLSGLASGASWLCYFRGYFRALKLGDASRVAPINKLSVPLVAVLPFCSWTTHFSAQHFGRGTNNSWRGFGGGQRLNPSHLTQNVQSRRSFRTKMQPMKILGALP